MMDCAEENQELLERVNSEFATRLLPVTFFVGTEIVVGFFGNLLILYIFIFRYHECNFRTFVICLSFIDILCTLTTMPGEIVTHRFWYKYPVTAICKSKDFFNVFTVFTDTLCLLAIAIDRYRKVCRPLQWQIGNRMAVVLCLILLVIGIGVAAPAAHYWGTICKQVQVGNVTINSTQCKTDQKFEGKIDPLVYVAVVAGFVFLFFIAMFIMYVQVLKVLIQERRSNLPKTRTASSIRIHKKTSSMIILTGCFMVTTILYYVMVCLLGSPETIFNQLSTGRKVAFLFFLRFYFVQHIINPILYCILDPTVKDVLSEMKQTLVHGVYRIQSYKQ